MDKKYIVVISARVNDAFSTEIQVSKIEAKTQTEIPNIIANWCKNEVWEILCINVVLME